MHQPLEIVRVLVTRLKSVKARGIESGVLRARLVGGSKSDWLELGNRTAAEVASITAPEDGRSPAKWSKIAINFTVSLPGGGGVVGFGWIRLDWVGPAFAGGFGAASWQGGR